MKTDTFKTRKFMGIDFTPRKRYRAEIERLERVNADIRRSFAEGEKDRNNLLKKVRRGTQPAYCRRTRSDEIYPEARRRRAFHQIIRRINASFLYPSLHVARHP